MNWNKFNAGLGKNIAPFIRYLDITADSANIETLNKKSVSINTFFSDVYLLRMIGIEAGIIRNCV